MNNGIIFFISLLNPKISLSLSKFIYIPLIAKVTRYQLLEYKTNERFYGAQSKQCTAGQLHAVPMFQ